MPIPVRRLLAVTFGLAAFVLLAQTSLHLVNGLLLESEYNNFNADAEGNAWAWASSVAQFTAGVGALLAFLCDRRRSFAVLAFVLAYFSVDDSIRIHETAIVRLDRALGIASDYERYMFAAVYFPVFVLTALMLLQAARRAPRRAGTFILLGVSLLVFAVACEVVGTKWAPEGDAQPTTPYVIEVALEEGAELLGWILIAGGLLAYACTRMLAFGRQETAAS